jgi:cell division GTPase FtsZ
MNSNQVQLAFENLLKKYETVLIKLKHAQEQVPEVREVVMPLSSKAERMYIDKIRLMEQQLKTLKEESAPSSNLEEAARLLVNSDFNKEDLSEKEIFDILQKLSEDEVNKALGFWAVPLPSEDNDPSDKPRYTSKK